MTEQGCNCEAENILLAFHGDPLLTVEINGNHDFDSAQINSMGKNGRFHVFFKKATYLEFESTKSRKSSEPGTVAAWW